MDKQQAARDIIAQALPQVAFEGWTMGLLKNAALDAGYKKTDAIRVFPGGAIDAVNAFFHLSDEEMEHVLQGYHLESMKIRERIATAVRIRICIHESHPEAVRRALAMLALPFFCHHGLRNLYNTTDAIWYAAGDKSTDFNFYTKRMMLAAVYMSTLRFWLDDESAGKNHTWEFLERRIENVMSIERAKHRAKAWMRQL